LLYWLMDLISFLVIETWPTTWQLVVHCLTTCPIIQINFESNSRRWFKEQ
jgi:hypothetical protein